MSKITYKLTEQTRCFHGDDRVVYGIGAFFEATELLSIQDITTDRARLAVLVQKCNSSELSLIHLHDVIEDFLTN